MMTRLVVGLSGLAILVPALVWGGVLAAEIIVLLVLLVCIGEYVNMAFPAERNPGYKPWAVGWLGLGIAVQYVGIVHFPDVHSTALALYCIATLIFVTLLPGEELAHAADRAARYALGVAWIGLLPWLVRLRAEPDGLAWCFVVLGIAWLGDTGAYFAGRTFGRHKLYERISPKKTVEGMIGGVITATAGVFLITAIGGVAAGPIDCLVLGIVGCVAGVLGDLSESMLKRAFGVKDAGSIMPGHGGLLDRIDSVLFVGALVFAYAKYVFR